MQGKLREAANHLVIFTRTAWSPWALSVRVGEQYGNRYKCTGIQVGGLGLGLGLRVLWMILNANMETALHLVTRGKLLTTDDQGSGMSATVH